MGINGQIIAGRSMDDIKRMVVGPVGTPVELFIQRGRHCAPTCRCHGPVLREVRTLTSAACSAAGGARFPVQLVRGGVGVASRGPHGGNLAPAPLISAPSSRVANHAARPMSGSGQRLGGEAAGQGVFSSFVRSSERGLQSRSEQ